MDMPIGRKVVAKCHCTFYALATVPPGTFGAVIGPETINLDNGVIVMCYDDPLAFETCKEAFDRSFKPLKSFEPIE